MVRHFVGSTVAAWSTTAAKKQQLVDENLGRDQPGRCLSVRCRDYGSLAGDVKRPFPIAANASHTALMRMMSRLFASLRSRSVWWEEIRLEGTGHLNFSDLTLLEGNGIEHDRRDWGGWYWGEDVKGDPCPGLLRSCLGWSTREIVGRTKEEISRGEVHGGK